MNSESGQRLSVEELKQLNRPQTLEPSTTPPPPMVLLTAADWNMLLNRLERLEANVGAQEALLREISSKAGKYPTQAQMKALARDVAQMRSELQQAGKKRELRFSMPKLRLPYIPWSSLLLGLMTLLLTGAMLWVVWSSWGKLWSAIRTLIP